MAFAEQRYAGLGAPVGRPARRNVAPRRPPLLVQAPAGEPQEDVLEGRVSDQRRVGREALVVEGRGALLGVVGVEHQGVSVSSCPSRRSVERGDQSVRVATLAELQLEHLAPDVLADEAAGRPQ